MVWLRVMFVFFVKRLPAVEARAKIPANCIIGIFTVMKLVGFLVSFLFWGVPNLNQTKNPTNYITVKNVQIFPSRPTHCHPSGPQSEQSKIAFFRTILLSIHFSGWFDYFFSC